MIDINLHQAVEEDLKINRKKSILKSGTFLAFSLLAVVLTTYAIVKTYQKKLIGDKNEIIATKKNELSSFDLAKVNNLVDFKNRLDITSFNLQNKDNPEKILNNIEKTIIKGVSLNSLSYDVLTNTLSMEVVADSVKLASSQVLSFKKSGMFSSVLLSDSGDGKEGNMSRDDANRAVFTISAKLKNQKVEN